MAKTEVKFGEWIEKGFNLYKNNLVLLILVSLVAMALSTFTMGILAGPMMAGICLVMLQLFDQKEPKPEVGMVFKGFGYFVQSFLFVLVWGLGMVIVSILLSIVPCIGTFVAMFVIWSVQALLMFAIFFIVEEQMEFWPASMKSIETVKENFWPFLGFFVVISIIGSIGAVLCVIGAVVTAPIQFCIMTVAYREIFSGKTYTPAETQPAAETTVSEASEPPAPPEAPETPEPPDETEKP